MTRWTALALTAAVASLAGAASAPEAPDRSNELVPTMPWATPDAATPAPAVTRADGRLPGPASRASVLPRSAPESAPSAPAAGGAPPAVDAVGDRWYQRRQAGPERLYLEQLLHGDIVHGAGWDSDPAEPWGADDATDDALSFGLDGRLERTTVQDENGNAVEAVMLGPKMRWRLGHRTQIDVTQLVGVGAPYSMSEVAIAFGWKY
ncbi:MAG TPA: hypothetical protein VFD43_05855 [Planctomycetota bacterium]|nr:hypothetical protein [Planctomycetota bacterium]